MEKREKITIVVITTFIFAVLFYHQYIGLNFGILGLIIWGIAHVRFKHVNHDKKYWILSIYIIITSLGQMYYGDQYSFFALFFALLTYTSYLQFKRLNIVLYPILLGLNYVIFPFRILIANWMPKKNKEENNRIKKVLAFVIFPLTISLTFLLVYSTGSDLLHNFIKNFKLNINLFHFIGIFILGFFFLFNFWMLYIPRTLVKFNQIIKPEYTEKERNSIPLSKGYIDLDIKRISGNITLVMLSLTLILFIVIYTYEQFFATNDITRLSSDTHTRINTIIASIVLAIVVILLYFKSFFNFDSKAKIMRRLATLWLILNSLLVLSAFVKTIEYVYVYGLTFKRIGVIIFLLLCLIGLTYSHLKIKKQKTNSYLITKMAWAFYSFFIVCSVINFSWITTKYNLYFQKNIDYYYLKKLEYNKNLLIHHLNSVENQVKIEHPELSDFVFDLNYELNKPLLSQRLYYTFLNE